MPVSLKRNESLTDAILCQGIATLVIRPCERCGVSSWENKNARQGIATPYQTAFLQNHVGLGKQKCPSGHCDDHVGGFKHTINASWENKNARQEGLTSQDLLR